MTTRLAVLLGLLCITAGGCAATTAGTALPVAPIPPTTADTLSALLLSASEVGTVLARDALADDELADDELAGDELVVTRDVRELWNDGARFESSDCLAIGGAAQEGVYANSGWTGMHGQILRDPPTAPEWSHFAVQAVVLFETTRAAADFFARSQSSWAGCSDRDVTYIQRPAPDQLWSVGPSSTDADDVLSVSRTQRGPQRWSCQRALAVRVNVAVDVEACSVGAPTSAAAAIATMIGERLPAA